MNCSFGSEESVCGPFGANCTFLPLVKCEEDMTSHLISLGVSSKRGRRSIPTLSESNLILNRAGLFGLGLQRTGEMTICPHTGENLQSTGRDEKVVRVAILRTEVRENR